MRSFQSEVHEVILYDPEAGRSKFFLILGNEDGKLCYIDIFSSKIGSTIRGSVDSLGNLLNACLANEETFVETLANLSEMSYSPRGSTNDPNIPQCSSIPNYVAQKIALDFPALKVDAEA